jgi:hypothetical protein
MVELTVVIPLLVLLATIIAGVLYVEWQGVKTQEAANLAARLEGQEHISGGKTPQQIALLNGNFEGLSREMPTLNNELDRMTDQEWNHISNSGGGNNGILNIQQKMLDMVRKFIGRESAVQTPVIGTATDSVTVDRAVGVPAALGGGDIVIHSTAYSGAEDTYMYGLPRWGPTDGSQDLSSSYWIKIIKARQAEINTHPANPE